MQDCRQRQLAYKLVDQAKQNKSYLRDCLRVSTGRDLINHTS